jgi:hypothetical protein
MGTVLLVLLLPLVLALVGVIVVVKLALLLVRVAFAPVAWLNGEQQRQRVTIRHFDGRV